MNIMNPVQLSQLITDPTPKTIITEVKRIFSYHYSLDHFSKLNGNYLLVKKLFEGKFPGYKACNTEYHDCTHTFDTLLTTARLIDGYNIKNRPLPVSLATMLLMSALLHDTGYIQEDWDNEGTGGKYTAIHVERSIQFLTRHHHDLGINPDEIKTMSNLILCTDLKVGVETLPFSTPEEHSAGCILGTADLLCQMSDRAYLEKLLFLYYEFREAGIEGYNTEFDILRKTVGFYDFMKKRFADSYLHAYDYALPHFQERYMIDHNLYTEAIDRHIAYLYKIIEDDSTNFRHKLRRGNWVHTYPHTRP